MNSDYQAVTDQSGFFAGKGGYTIDVAKNTTLQGAVIASDATADKNLLLTDRLLVSDIKNKSEIKSQSAGVSVSGSYSGGASTLTPGALYGMALNDSDHSYTRSAVSEGTIVVRNPEGAGDLVGLNRDTANANQRLDKPDEKSMQERMDLIKSSMELTKGIGDAIAAARIRAADDPNSDVNKATRDKLVQEGVTNPTRDQINQRAQQDYGVGSSFQKASQAVTAVVQAAMGGSVGGALAGAAAPYLAQTVKKMTDGDPNASLMAHAVLGAVLARAGGNSALAGAAGAVVAEKTAQLIKESLYGRVSNENLSEAQKQTISSLSTLAAGLSGSLVGKDALNAVAAAQVGKNAVENNSLGEIASALAEGKTLEQKAEERVKAENERYKEQNCAGMSAQACSVQMYDQRHETLAYTVAGVAVVAVSAAGAMLLGPALLNACGMNPVVCTELALTAVELPFGAATAGGTALGVGGFGSLAAKEVAATADAAAAARVAEGAKGILRIDPNGSFTQSEINSAYYMAAQGKKVELRSPVGTRAEGNTSDLLVDGVRYDVYTPTTGNADRIISAIAKKNTQTEGVVLDLSKSSVTREQLGDVLRRVNGSGAKNINDVVIIGK